MGSGSVSVDQGILLAVAATGLGGFTIARRTLDTIGEGITDIPIHAAMIVSFVGATIITVLSELGIPASLAVSMTSCVIGLGWGRASRAVTLTEAASAALEDDADIDFSTGALIAEVDGNESDAEATTEPLHSPTIGDLAAERDQSAEKRATRDAVTGPHVPKIGEDNLEELVEDAPVLFNRAATGQIVFLWLLTPTLSTLGSYVVFELLLYFR